jgi:hypothetical protein
MVAAAEQSFNFVAQFHELVVFEGLVEISIRTEVAHLLSVSLGVGCGNCDNQSLCTPAALAHIPQHIAALHFRQIDIEDYQGGARNAHVALGAIEKPHSLVSIAHEMQGKRKLRRVDRFLYQEHVGFIIFDDQNMGASVSGGFLTRGS